MPRKPSPPTPEYTVALNKEALAATTQTMDTFSALDRRTEASAEVGILVGRMQAFEFMSQASNTALVATYVKLRDALHALGSIEIRVDGSLIRYTNLDDLCPAVIGKSASMCQKLLGQVQMLGEGLYAATERLGFKTRDYQALKALPVHDQARVKAAIESADKTEAIDLLHELAGRIAARDKRVAEMTEDIAAKDVYIEQQSKKIDKLQTRGKWKPSEDSIARSEEEAAVLDALSEAKREARHALSKILAAVGDVAAIGTAPMRLRAAEALHFIAVDLAEVAHENSLEIDLQAPFDIPD